MEHEPKAPRHNAVDREVEGRRVRPALVEGGRDLDALVDERLHALLIRLPVVLRPQHRTQLVGERLLPLGGARPRGDGGG